MSYVFIRLDKIGDLVATLPVDQHSELASQKIKWVISKGLGTIVSESIPHREYIEIDPSKKNWKESYHQLLAFLKSEKPSAVVVFYAPWWVSLACFMAKVPLRVSRKSQWHSFLFFNKSIRQSRSEAKKHEADYNQELAEVGLNLPPEKTKILKLNPSSNPHLLEKYLLNKNQYIVLHPGMFGSALNWPNEMYENLIEELVKTETIVITGTAQDERFLTNIKLKFEHHKNIRILQNKLSLKELLSILSMSKSVIAPSTGVLHLAASLGKPVIGFYSPITVHHPTRWRPRSEVKKNASVFLPPVKCPAQLKCLNEACEYHPCMAKITVPEVLNQIHLYGTPAE